MTGVIERLGKPERLAEDRLSGLAGWERIARPRSWSYSAEVILTPALLVTGAVERPLSELSGLAEGMVW